MTSVILIIAIALIVSISIGLFIGMLGGRLFLKLLNHRNNKGMKKLLEGNYKNVINIDGKDFEVDSFRVEDKIISLKGGYKLKDANKKEKVGKEKSKLQEKHFAGINKDKRSHGKKKRIVGNRILKRYG